MQNPYNKYTLPVEGDRLVGRDVTIRQIQESLLVGGSCSLSGLRRIGKTSVAKQIKKNIDSLGENYSTCYIPIDTCQNEANFYKHLVQKLFHKNDFFETDDPFDMYLSLCDYLSTKVCEGDFNGIVIIDEFDFLASKNFHNATNLINRLREIINGTSDFHLSFLIVSAKSLKWLQDNTSNTSPLYGSCQSHYLAPFKINELEELLKRGNLDSSEILETIFHITGGHPYLSSALLYWLFEKNGLIDNVTSEDIQLIRCNTICAQIFSEYYDILKSFFSSWQEDENVWESLRNTTVGPYIQEPTINAIDLLTAYGIIDNNGNCFSEDFHDYLELQCRQTPIWPQIANLERDLRYLIKTVFIKQMGNNWIDELKKEDAFFENLFGELEQIMKKEQKKFNRGNYSDILEYSYLYNLKDIILRKWSWFQEYLGDSKPHFLQLIEPICVIRNPLAHNRKPELIPHDKQDLAKDACSKLEGILSQSFEKLMAD